VSPQFPVFVTVKLLPSLPKLQQPRERDTLLAAFEAARLRAGRSGKAFRLTHFAIRNDQMHFLIEAEDREALSRGMQGLLTRIAIALNRLWQRRGTIFADRYYDRVLTSPRSVQQALRHVLTHGNG
jgi:REP element-mobilizing transposase RayT